MADTADTTGTTEHKGPERDADKADKTAETEALAVTDAMTAPIPPTGEPSQAKQDSAASDGQTSVLPSGRGDDSETQTLATGGVASGGPERTSVLPTASHGDEAQASCDAGAASTAPTGGASGSGDWQAPFSGSADPAPGANSANATPYASGAAAPGGQGPVWSASTVAPPANDAPQPQTRSTGTLVWGSILVLLGVLLIAVGLGAHVDLVTTSIVVLAGIGAVLLIMALLPRRSRS